MTIKSFVENFIQAKVVNSKVTPNAVSEYLQKHLEIRKYMPFKEKRLLAEIVVNQNTEEIDGVQKNDAINQYIAFICAMITAHTNLEFSDDPIADYDLLAENGLLPYIIAEFQESYNECEVILKMALSMRLEDNNMNVLFGNFLNSVLKRLDGVGEILKDKVGNLDLKEILGADFNEEDLAKLGGFLNTYIK